MASTSYSAASGAGPRVFPGGRLAEKDLVREADQALARASRSLAEARKLLENEIKEEMLGVVLTPGLRKDDPVAETDTEAGYARRLEGAMKADLARMAGTKL